MQGWQVRVHIPLCCTSQHTLPCAWHVAQAGGNHIPSIAVFQFARNACIQTSHPLTRSPTYPPTHPRPWHPLLQPTFETSVVRWPAMTRTLRFLRGPPPLPFLPRLLRRAPLGAPSPPFPSLPSAARGSRQQAATPTLPGSVWRSEEGRAADTAWQHRAGRQPRHLLLCAVQSPRCSGGRGGSPHAATRVPQPLHLQPSPVSTLCAPPALHAHAPTHTHSHTYTLARHKHTLPTLLPTLPLFVVHQLSLPLLQHALQLRGAGGIAGALVKPVQGTTDE